MKKFTPLQFCFLTAMAMAVQSAFAEDLLVGGDPILVPDSKGSFDFLRIDEGNNRLLASHTGNDTVDVFELPSGKLLKHVATGKAQDVAVDSAAGKYYVSVSREKKVCVIDSKTLEMAGEIKLDGEADAAVFNPKNHCFYVGHDDEKEVWVVDMQKNAVTASISIPAGPEVVVYDAASDRLFQNIKSNDTMAVIDPATNRIQQSWPTAPAQRPHGLVLNSKTNHLLCAGANGKMVAIDTSSGKVLNAVEITAGVDQVAFDPILQRAYAASGKGEISVVEDGAAEARLLGSVKTQAGAKTVACDPKTHDVWIAYGDATSSHIRRFQTK